MWQLNIKTEMNKSAANHSVVVYPELTVGSTTSQKFIILICFVQKSESLCTNVEYRFDSSHKFTTKTHKTESKCSPPMLMLSVLWHLSFPNVKPRDTLAAIYIFLLQVISLKKYHVGWMYGGIPKNYHKGTQRAQDSRQGQESTLHSEMYGVWKHDHYIQYVYIYLLWWCYNWSVWNHCPEWI